MGMWRGVKAPKRAATFYGSYGSEDIETGVLSMLDQRNASGPGGICDPGKDCQAWRVLMDRSASKIGCAALETDRADTIIVCATDWERDDDKAAAY